MSEHDTKVIAWGDGYVTFEDKRYGMTRRLTVEGYNDLLRLRISGLY